MSCPSHCSLCPQGGTFVPCGELPLWVSPKVPFHLGKLRHRALLHPRVEGQRTLDGGTEGTVAEPPKLIPRTLPALGDRQNKAGGGCAPCTQAGDSP